MNRIFAALLAAWVFAGPAFADSTIDHLGAGAAVQSTDIFPAYQGANPVTGVTASQIRTYANSASVATAVATSLSDSTIRVGTIGTTSVVSSLALGTASSGRVVCDEFSILHGVTIRSVTFTPASGVAVPAPWYGSTTNGYYTACALLPTGTTATMTVVASGSTTATSDGVVAITGSNGAYPFAVLSTPSSASGNIAVPASGAVIAYSGGASAGAWAGVTQLLAYNANGSSIGAFNNSGSGIDSRAVSYSTASVMVALSFAPVTQTTRTKLLNNTTFYVTTGGGDASGNGSATTPWATLQNAVNQLSQYYDCSGYNVTISLGTGSFAGADLRTQVGCPSVYVLGQGKANTTITASIADGLFSAGQNLALFVPATYFFDQLKVDGSANSAAETMGVYAGAMLMGNPTITGGDVQIVCNSTNWMVKLENTGATWQDTAALGTMTITCPSNPGFAQGSGGFVSIESNYTLSQSWTMSTGFVNGYDGGQISGFHSTFAGSSATGPTCVLTMLAFVDTGGLGTSHFPGNVACSGAQLTLGAQYN